MSHEYLTRREAWQDCKESSRELRAKVFIEEQGVPKEIEWDGRDEECIHVITRLDGKALATGRLLPEGKIGRLAVESEFRGKGLGAQVLAALIDEAQALGFLKVYLNAQVSAQAFYHRAGFLPYGEVFEEAGIDHQAMALTLDVSQTKIRDTQVATNTRLFALGARHNLKIETSCDNLTSLFDEHLRRELTLKLRDNPRFNIQLLTWDDAGLGQQAPHLVEWLQRLSSRVELRVLDRGTYAYRSVLVAAWPTGGIMQDNEVFHQFPANSPKMKILDEEFDRRWAAAKISNHLRRV